jgi:hypothetical protein
VRYKETKLTPNLVNAGKYFSSIMIQGASAYKVKAKSDFASTLTWSLIALGSTIYCLYWDYTKDWGLFKTKKPGRKYLREELKYPVLYYYFAMVTNFFLRFLWVLGIPSFSDPVKKQLVPFIQCIGEGYRRAQWALFRIENE